MSAIDDLFQRLRKEDAKAFMPFLTAGDPDLHTTERLIQLFAEKGCHLCEVGIPYSDPIADGPVIQASYTRALEHQIHVSDIMTSLARVGEKIEMPIVSMVSYAIIFRQGLKGYAEAAKAAGLSGLIVPDLPVDEADALSEICSTFDLSLIQLITPTTPRDRAVRIANSSSGFIYYVSVTGITGARDELPPEVADQVRWLRDETDLPICIGFGISRPDHIQMLRDVADGFIVGSAIVRYFERFANEPAGVVEEELGAFLDRMVAAAQA